MKKLAEQIALYYKEFEEKLQKYYRIIIYQQKKIQQLQERISWYAQSGTPDEWQKKMKKEIDDKNSVYSDNVIMDEELDEMEDIIKNSNDQLSYAMDEIKELKIKMKIMKKEELMNNHKELFAKGQLDEFNFS